MSKTSPTQRTLKWLRDQGYTAAITEHWNSFVKRRQDLFGFVDIIALGDGVTIGVQATSGSNVSARVEKICGSDHVAAWINGRNRLLVVGWSKKGPRGKVKRWTPTLREIVLIGESPIVLPDTELTRS